MNRRVVITGMGIWSCLGTDLETVKQSLYEGKSGIGMQPERLEYGYRSALTGIVEEPVITKRCLIVIHVQACQRKQDMLICRVCRHLSRQTSPMNIFVSMKLAVSLVTILLQNQLLRLQR